jgi:hypothetical protein
VAYGSLLHHRRRALHARIVGAIERIHADRLSEHGDRLAHHAFRGEMWEKALHYLREMGAAGSKPSIDAAAVMGGAASPGHLWFRGEYDRALTLAQRERTFSASFGNFGWAVLSNYRLGQIYHSLGDYPKATEALTRTVALLEGDLKRQMFEAAGLPAVMSRVWLAFCVAECGNAREAAALAEEATALTEEEDRVQPRRGPRGDRHATQSRRPPRGRDRAAGARSSSPGWPTSRSCSRSPPRRSAGRTRSPGGPRRGSGCWRMRSSGPTTWSGPPTMRSG